jgi:hypothetical protein
LKPFPPFSVLVDGVFPRPHVVTTLSRLPGAAMADDNLPGAPPTQTLCRLRSWRVAAGTLELEFDLVRHALSPAQDVSAGSPAESKQPSAAGRTGVCTVVRTSDELLIIQQRRITQFRYPGWYHVCGGVLEPSIVDGALLVDPFGWMARELCEELGIEPAFIAGMRCLGLVRDELNQGPEIIFVTDLNVPAHRFARDLGPEHGDLLHLADQAASLSHFVAAHGAETVPSGLACLLLYGKQRFGPTWRRAALSMIGS